jgi:hypothetical protein
VAAAAAAAVAAGGDIATTGAEATSHAARRRVARHLAARHLAARRRDVRRHAVVVYLHLRRGVAEGTAEEQGTVEEGTVEVTVRPRAARRPAAAPFRTVVAGTLDLDRARRHRSDVMAEVGTVARDDRHRVAAGRPSAAATVAAARPRTAAARRRRAGVGAAGDAVDPDRHGRRHRRAHLAHVGAVPRGARHPPPLPAPPLPTRHVLARPCPRRKRRTTRARTRLTRSLGATPSPRARHPPRRSDWTAITHTPGPSPRLREEGGGPWYSRLVQHTIHD